MHEGAVSKAHQRHGSLVETPPLHPTVGVERHGERARSGPGVESPGGPRHDDEIIDGPGLEVAARCITEWRRPSWPTADRVEGVHDIAEHGDSEPLVGDDPLEHGRLGSVVEVVEAPPDGAVVELNADCNTRPVGTGPGFAARDDSAVDDHRRPRLMERGAVRLVELAPTARPRRGRRPRRIPAASPTTTVSPDTAVGVVARPPSRSTSHVAVPDSTLAPGFVAAVVAHADDVEAGGASSAELPQPASAPRPRRMRASDRRVRDAGENPDTHRPAPRLAVCRSIARRLDRDTGPQPPWEGGTGLASPGSHHTAACTVVLP